MEQSLYQLSLIKSEDLHMMAKKESEKKHSSLRFHYKACVNLFLFKEQHFLIVLYQLSLSFAVIYKKEMSQKSFSLTRI